jgi:hypothetical protein
MTGTSAGVCRRRAPAPPGRSRLRLGSDRGSPNHGSPLAALTKGYQSAFAALAAIGLALALLRPGRLPKHNTNCQNRPRQR